MTDGWDQGLVKVLAELSDSEWPKGERFWAEPLGDDLYRLRNSPFHAYDLHLLDIVRAVPKEPDGLPIVTEVVERSGHKTLRVVFSDAMSDDAIREFLDSTSAIFASQAALSPNWSPRVTTTRKELSL